MTRIMVVDDEVVFRNNIKNMLDWGAHGFSICGEASSGFEAKQLLNKLSPDIVITDICMPDVDGVSLITYIYRNYPQIQVIALSGYDEYDYVRTSMKHGVIDYLLKHQLTPKSLLDVLNTAQRRIGSEKKQQKDYILRLDHLEQGRAIYRQKFLSNVLNGAVKDKQTITTQLVEHGIPLDISNIIIVVAEIDGISNLKQKFTNHEWQSVFNQAVDLVRKIVSDKGENVVVAQSDNRFTILFSMKQNHSALVFYNGVRNCINQIRVMLKKHYNLTACYSMSEGVHDITRLSEFYEKTLAMLDDRIYKDYDIVIREKLVQNQTYQDYHITIKEEQRISQLVQVGERETLIEYLENIFDVRRKSHLDISRLNIIFAELLNLINLELRSDGLDMVDICPQVNDLFSHVPHMTFNDMKECVLDLFKKMMLSRENLKSPGEEHEVTDQAKKYVAVHYSSNISLAEISEHCEVTAPYLSRIFKEDTGKTLTEYINVFRIEKAKRLIQQGTKLNELYMKVGFNSNTYFYSVFKQITDKTPRDYKKDASTT